ncbi:PLD nuclease N-terminal domain-containing protein [Microbacterium sp. Marseille-Q6965]|uniref:PLD nuclease N-terminal domain-containing protein n=1 Tax=Microbacterium sp. Marseille-Q6965 TaxID=2965072 RepID=UPI0021B6FFF2|nr:PLDc N-terminal domain-containing protein [Microbacterium sp. Marseille-Q6965]
MARLIVILVVAAVVFTVFSVIDCAVQPATRHRGVSKGWWIVITCVPVIGGLLWFLIGRGRGLEARRARGPVAPDDDPAFLGSLGSIADQDERIRRLEEELAKLDDEDGSAGDAPKRVDPEDPSGDDAPDGSRGAIG